MRIYLAEMVGTFALVLAGTGAIVVNEMTGGAVTHVGVALAFGLAVMVAIYALGDISGAHINPAVTLGFFIAGRIGAGRAAGYAAAQVMGAVLGSGALWLLLGHSTLGATRPLGTAMQAFALEGLMTCGLMLVVLTVACGSKEKGLMAGVAIGGMVALEALVGGPISGASMNPARSLGPALMSGQLQGLWIYLVAPPLGAMAAVPLWHLMRVRGGPRLAAGIDG